MATATAERTTTDPSTDLFTLCPEHGTVGCTLEHAETYPDPFPIEMAADDWRARALAAEEGLQGLRDAIAGWADDGSFEIAADIKAAIHAAVPTLRDALAAYPRRGPQGT